MFAKSEKITAVGGEHIPLFAKQTPLPVTVTAKAKAAVKQYQLCKLNNDGTVEPIIAVSDFQALPAGNQLCITAYDAEANKGVSVYTQGTFNVNAIVVEVGAFKNNYQNPERLEKLRLFASPVIFFEDCETNPVQRT